ncbi:MAG: 4Fe-4S binding protein [Desulfobacterales bacterium]|nr:4Fe-4S binding protein [Desulfobacterales bacterium]
MANTEIELCGIKLKNPIIVAAGNLSQDGEKARKSALAGAGAVVTKTAGNPKHPCYSPAYVRISQIVPETHFSPTRQSTPGYMTMGHDHWITCTAEDWLERELDIALKGGVPIIINTSGSPRIASAEQPHDAWKAHAARKAELATRFEKKGASGIELTYQTAQFACLGSGVDTNQMQMVIRAVKQAVQIPVWVKMPYMHDIEMWAAAAESAGADAVVFTGAARVVEIDPEAGRLAVPTDSGWTAWQGAGRRPLTMYCVAKCTAHGIKIPIIANGGVWSSIDIIKFIMAGATAVQLLTAITMEGMGTIRKLNSEIKQWLDSHGYKSLDDIRGLAIETWGEIHQEEFKARVDPKQCNGCGLCVHLCRRGRVSAIRLDEDRGLAHVDQSKCIGCAYCTIVCPSGAISLAGWPPPRKNQPK